MVEDTRTLKIQPRQVVNSSKHQWNLNLSCTEVNKTTMVGFII